MNAAINQSENIVWLQSLIKGLEINPIRATNLLEEKVSQLLQNHDFEPFREGLQSVQRRLEDIKFKLAHGQELDLPIEAVGLINIIRRITAPTTRLISDLEANLPFGRAIHANDYMEIRRLLLARPESINERYTHYSDLLFSIACHFSSTSIVNLLIRSGANVSSDISSSSPPLLASFIGGKSTKEKVALLLAAGANPNQDCRLRAEKLSTSIFVYGKTKDIIESLPLLAEAGLDLNEPISEAISKVIDGRRTLSDLSPLVKALVFNGAQATLEEEVKVKDIAILSELRRFVVIRNNVLHQLGPSSIISQLVTLESLRTLPIDLLRTIDNYRIPTPNDIRELCYEQDRDSI